MKFIRATVVAALFTIVLSQPGFAKNATTASKMSGTDAVFGSTGKCHGGQCPVSKAASHSRRSTVETKHADHRACRTHRPG
jgi:hypothetical protein